MKFLPGGWHCEAFARVDLPPRSLWRGRPRAVRAKAWKEYHTLSKMTPTEGAFFMRVTLLVLLFGVVVIAQNPTPTTIPNGLPEWAYNIPDKVQPPEAKEPSVVRVTGSSKEYEASAIAGDANPPDWFPDEHPAAPRSVKRSEERRVGKEC